MEFSRRAVVGGAAIAPAFAVSGCGFGSAAGVLSITPPTLLKQAVDRAMPTLKSVGGFDGTAHARITLPTQFAGQSGGSIVGAKIGNNGYREVLGRLVNVSAQMGAEMASPLIDSAVSNVGAVDGGASPTPATDALRRALGGSLSVVVKPAIDARLKVLDEPMVTEALGEVIGIDHAGLLDDITAKAIEGMFTAIAYEEMSLRGIARPA